MKILVVGHASHKQRQKNLFLEKSFKKDKILICAPKKWCGIKIVGKKYKNVEIKSLPCKRQDNISKYILKGLNKIINNFRPDIIYYQGEPWTLMALKCAIISRVRKIPLFIYTFENLQRVYRRRDKKFFGLNRLLEKIVYKNSKIIAGNKDAKEIIKKRGFAGEIFILPISGINENQFAKPSKKDGAKMLFVGRVVKEKGIGDILEALGKFKDNDENFVLGLVGYGEDRNYFKKRAISLGLKDNIKFLGQKKYSSIPKYMKKARVFFYPSRRSLFWEEQFGFSIAEALSCGCEVITTKTGAIPEWFGKWVWLVDEKTPSQILSCLKKINNGGRKNTYKGEYSLENVAKKTRKIMEMSIR